MATDTNDTSTDEQDEENASGGSDEGGSSGDQSADGSAEGQSQKEMAAEFEEQKQKQLRESKRRVGTFQLAATVLLLAIGLSCLYFGTSVGPTSHPLVQNGLYALGILNIVLALAVQIRKNWSRTLVLFAMPLTIIAILLTFENTTKSSLLVIVLCMVELYLMFRQPVLDEYDAPKE